MNKPVAMWVIEYHGKPTYSFLRKDCAESVQFAVGDCRIVSGKFVPDKREAEVADRG